MPTYKAQFTLLGAVPAAWVETPPAVSVRALTGTTWEEGLQPYYQGYGLYFIETDADEVQFVAADATAVDHALLWASKPETVDLSPIATGAQVQAVADSVDALPATVREGLATADDVQTATTDILAAVATARDAVIAALPVEPDNASIAAGLAIVQEILARTSQATITVTTPVAVDGDTVTIIREASYTTAQGLGALTFRIRKAGVPVSLDGAELVMQVIVDTISLPPSIRGGYTLMPSPPGTQRSRKEFPLTLIEESAEEYVLRCELISPESAVVYSGEYEFWARWDAAHQVPLGGGKVITE